METTRVERTGASPGLIRALFTLLGVAGAAALIWAAQLFDLDSGGEFWAAMGVLAAAGLVLGLSQLFGGWTKWGMPTVSPMVFLVGFLPTLALGGWLLLARQPGSGWEQERFAGWTDDVGLASFADDLATFLPIVPVIVGLVLAFSFDTTGPRTHVVEDERVEEERAVPAEDAPADQETVAEQLRRERDEDRPVEPVAAGAPEERQDTVD